MIDFTKPLRVDTPARAGMGAVDAAYAAGWCDACIGKQYGTQKPTPEQAAALQPGEAQEDDRTSALQRVRQIALQSETAPLSMCEIIKRVDIALGEETPLPDWFFAAIKDAPPATQPEEFDTCTCGPCTLHPAAQVTVAEAALFEARKELQAIKEMVMRGNQRNTIMDKCEAEQVRLDAALRALAGDGK